MMKMSMADQVKINLNPFQSVIDSLAIDPQRGRQLIPDCPFMVAAIIRLSRRLRGAR